MIKHPWRPVAALALVAGAGAVVWLSLSVGGAAPVPDLPIPPMPPPHPWDKLLHVLAYAVLTVLGLVLLPARRPWLVGGAAGVLVFATLLELWQGTVDGRTASLADAVANAVGVALGLAVVAGIRRRGRAARS